MADSKCQVQHFLVDMIGVVWFSYHSRIINEVKMAWKKYQEGLFLSVFSLIMLHARVAVISLADSLIGINLSPDKVHS